MAMLRQDGRVGFPSLAPGRYAVSLIWFEDYGTGECGVPLDLGAPPILTVVDTSGPQSFSLVLPVGVLERARKLPK